MSQIKDMKFEKDSHMPFQQKKLLRVALEMALTVAHATSNPIDDIIVTAAATILNRVFDLEMDI